MEAILAQESGKIQLHATHIPIIFCIQMAEIAMRCKQYILCLK